VQGLALLENGLPLGFLLLGDLLDELIFNTLARLSDQGRQDNLFMSLCHGLKMLYFMQVSY
jgi:hypothetical protein